jgi:hypothetical protein
MGKYRQTQQPAFMVVPVEDPPKRRAWPVRAARWASRNRLWLVPFAVPWALLMFGHITHAAGWWWWAIPAEILVGAAAFLGAPDRWDRSVEVLFVRVSAVAVTCWLVAAAVFGVFNRWMGYLLLGGWIVWAICWGLHKRTRRHDKTIAAWDEDWQLVAHRTRPVQMTGSRIIDVRQGDDVDSLLVALDRGRQSPTDLRNAGESILAAWEYPPDTTFRVEAHDRNRSWAWFHIQHANPLRAEREWSQDDAPRSFLDRFVVGFRPDGSLITTLLRKAHWFIVGQTQWGKSTWLSLLMAQLSACDDVLIWVIDLKGGGTARPWLPCIDWLATTHDEAERMLQAAKNITLARSALTDDHVPSPEDPAIAIIIDEANEAWGQGTGTSRLVSLGVSVASLGAGLSVHLFAATQIGALYALGDERIRGNMSKTMAFRCQHDSHAEYALSDWAKLSASKLSEPGMFYFKDQDAPSVLGRGFWLSRPERARIARQNASRRPTLPDALARHAGEAYLTRRERATLAATPPPSKETVVSTPEELAAEIEAGLPEPVSREEMDAANQARAEDGLPPLSASAALQTAQDRFVAALQSGTPHSPKRLVELSGMSRSAVMAYLAKLVEYGAVSHEGRGTPYQAVPGIDVGEAMEAIREERRRADAQAKELIDA